MSGELHHHHHHVPCFSSTTDLLSPAAAHHHTQPQHPAMAPSYASMSDDVTGQHGGATGVAHAGAGGMPGSGAHLGYPSSYDSYRHYGSAAYGHYDKHAGSLTPQLPTPSPGTPGSYQPLTPLTPTHSGTGGQEHPASSAGVHSSLASTNTSTSTSSSASSTKASPKDSNSKLAVIKQEAGDVTGEGNVGVERSTCSAREMDSSTAASLQEDAASVGGDGGSSNSGEKNTLNAGQLFPGAGFPNEKQQLNMSSSSEDPSGECSEDELPYSRQYSPFYMSSLPGSQQYGSHPSSYRNPHHHNSPFPPPLMPAPGLSASYRSSMVPMPPSFLGRSYPDLSDGK